MSRILLRKPAVAPVCFGRPARCEECAACGLRVRCYQRHVQRDAVHLLPVDRPAPVHRSSWGSAFTRPYKAAK